MRKNTRMEGLRVELVIIIRIAAEKLIEIITCLSQDIKPT